MKYTDFIYKCTVEEKSNELKISGYNSPYARMSNPPEEEKDILEAFRLGIFTLDKGEKKVIEFKMRFIKEGENIINKLFIKNNGK
jgi:hypothetical protein